MNTEHGEKSTKQGSIARVAIGVFLAIAAVLLVLEHRAHLLGTSPLLLFLLVCVGMHFLMHRGHGSHRNGDHGGERTGGGNGN